MAETTDHRPRPWLAFLAGAVVMLLIVLVWMAWNAAQSAVGSALRADFRRLSVPVPTAPPPEGPRLPRPPVPTPR
jgi:hypothetical protein